ncbi:hypothetical protein CSB11_01180 [Candidatus Campbellbacteria bacterium]|nr:MAG: hypothetical protein CSB11_01180 [Candidatus Campbellbacteria bacterium]
MKNIKECLEPRYQSTIKFVIIIILALVLIGVLAKDKSYNINLSELKDNTIRIKGEAEKIVAPDVASVSFEITRKSKSTKDATEYVNKRIKQLTDMLSYEGINQKDFKTASYNVHPEYNYTKGKRTFSGYRVSQRIDVKIRDLDNVSTILTKINQVGVDNVSRLKFFIDDDKEIKEELRKKAIENSKQKAEKIAKDLGVKLDEIVGFSEEANRDYEPRYLSNMKLAGAKEDAVELNQAVIPVGSNKITSTIYITYKISN